MEATLSTADNAPLIGPLALNLDDARAPYIISNTQQPSVHSIPLPTMAVMCLNSTFHRQTSGWMGRAS